MPIRHRDNASKKSQDLAAAQLLSCNDVLSSIDAVNLEHVLGNIQADRGNLHVDGSPQ
jgi:hypothetical protein